MASFAPLRVVCARPACHETRLGVDCQRCRLLRYCGSDCMAEDQPAHQSLCESDKNRRRQSYNVEEDAKRLAPGQGIPYRHCNAETPKPGNEPRLFSKHKVKCLISPQDQGRDEDGDEMNIRINGKTIRRTLKGLCL